jgi:pimeloyl-ACP methyl ester carboxylesterase
MRRLQPSREDLFLPIAPPTPAIHYLPDSLDPPLARVLVVHGLDSSKQFMQIFSSALADGGFEVFAIDLPGHGASPAGFEAITAEAALDSTLEYLGPDTIVVGHSLGAGLLLDLATRRSFKKLVLLSPPPTPLDRVLAEHVLIVTGDWDMPRINAFIPTLEDIAQPNACSIHHIFERSCNGSGATRRI